MKMLKLTATALALALATTAVSAWAQARQPADAAHAHATAAPTNAAALVIPVKKSGVSGTVRFTQEGDAVVVTGKISGLAPGMHGFYVHQYGDLLDLGSETAGDAAGGHYDPHGHKHGGLQSDERHAGDLGNIEANQDGVAEINVKAPGLKLASIVGRSIVVHGKADDLKTQPSGDSGPRVGIGVIGIVKSPTAKPAQ